MTTHGIDAADRMCRQLRHHPATIFYLMTIAAFAAGISGMTWLLGAILATELTTVVHVVAHTYGPRHQGRGQGQL